MTTQCSLYVLLVAYNKYSLLWSMWEGNILQKHWPPKVDAIDEVVPFVTERKMCPSAISISILVIKCSTHIE
jgi:hypothetical protein